MYFARSGSPGAGPPRRTRPARRGGGSASRAKPSASACTALNRPRSLCIRTRAAAPATPESASMAERPIEPSYEQVLEFCARDPVERVFLEDVARRGLGRFVARRRRRRHARRALPCSARTSSRRGAAAGRSPSAAARGGSRMIIGEERRGRRALARRRQRCCPTPRADRPGQPVYAIADAARGRRDRACAPATLDDLERLVPVCAAPAPRSSASTRSRSDADGFRWRTQRPDQRRPLLALARGRASSSSRPRLGLDARRGAGAAGLGRPRGARAAATVRAACATSAGCCCDRRRS